MMSQVWCCFYLSTGTEQNTVLKWCVILDRPHKTSPIIETVCGTVTIKDASHRVNPLGQYQCKVFSES